MPEAVEHRFQTSSPLGVEIFGSLVLICVSYALSLTAEKETTGRASARPVSLPPITVTPAACREFRNPAAPVRAPQETAV
jgi:hypothetical protein